MGVMVVKQYARMIVQVLVKQLAMVNAKNRVWDLVQHHVLVNVQQVVLEVVRTDVVRRVLALAQVHVQMVVVQHV